jgi:hypothetical protein
MSHLLGFFYFGLLPNTPAYNPLSNIEAHCIIRLRYETYILLPKMLVPAVHGGFTEHGKSDIP